jgi:hypothetical protein
MVVQKESGIWHQPGRGSKILGQQDNSHLSWPPLQQSWKHASNGLVRMNLFAVVQMNHFVRLALVASHPAVINSSETTDLSELRLTFA